MSKYILILKGDMNDADYTERTHIIDEKDAEIIRKVAKAIKNQDKKNRYCHNWDKTEYSDKSPSEMYKKVLTEEEIDYFNDLVPGGDYAVHSIESLTLVPFAKHEILL